MLGAVLLHEDDDVICLLRAHDKGDRPALAQGDGPELIEDVPLGHKVARRDIGRGETVRKWGAPVGRATQDIPMGAHVHLHNLKGLAR